MHDDDLAGDPGRPARPDRRARQHDDRRRGHADHRADRHVPRSGSRPQPTAPVTSSCGRATTASASAPTGVSRRSSRAPRVAGVYRVTLDGANWDAASGSPSARVDDFVRQDPHDTTIAIAVVDASTADAAYKARRRARSTRCVIDDDTAGRRRDRERRQDARRRRQPTRPGPGDSYSLRLTRRADRAGDGRARHRRPDRRHRSAAAIDLEAIGGQIGAAAVHSATSRSRRDVVTRVNASALGNFLDEGFAAGQLIRIANAGAASGDFTIAAGVALDGQTLTLTTAPGRRHLHAARSSAALVNRGLYTGSIAYDAAPGTLTRTDGTSWLDAASSRASCSRSAARRDALQDPGDQRAPRRASSTCCTIVDRTRRRCRRPATRR